MSKMNIDTDLIKNTVLPLAKNEVNKLNNAISLANKVSFPNGEYNWSSILGELNDCFNESKKYLNWLENIRDKFTNDMVNRVEEIDSIKVNEVKRRTSVVK